ncbi:hypothetical protein pb186bvf_001266 [Paramecium bursaria]
MLLSQEDLQRINYYASHNQRQSYRPRVYEIPVEDCPFKPQINKKSAKLQRTIDDLYRWNERKEQKLQQIFEDETNELFQSANRCSYQPDDKSPNVFDRLYVVRRSNEQRTYSNLVPETTKRNTSDSQPYFTKNMTTSQFSDFKKPQVEESQSTTPVKPCLPNRIFFETQAPVSPDPELKITTPQHMFLDFTNHIRQINQEPEPAPFKQPLQQKDVDTMIDRLNKWNQKKHQRIQEQQEKQHQNEASECTFKPKLNKSPILPSSYNNSVQQSNPQFGYSNLYFKNKQ